MISSYKIRDIEISPNLVLAPMSGVTTSPLRRLIKEINPGCVGYVLTEFVSVEGMTRSSRRTMEMIRFREMERPIAVQIFGYDIERMRDAAMIVEENGADIVDINCGCPAPKVVRRGGGAELMRQPEHLRKIFQAVRAAISIPLTMKMRSGWDEGSKNCVEIARMAEGEGVEAITVHGRTRAQLYHGLADWDYVSAVAQAVKIPVCGSGDITNRDEAEAQLKRAGVAGLYIGRAAMYNPYIFSQICGRECPDLRRDPLALVSLLERYIELMKEDLPDHSIIGKLKQLASQAGRGHGWRKELLRAMTLQDQCIVLERVRNAVERGEPLSSPAMPESQEARSEEFATERGIDSCDAFVSESVAE